MTHGHEVLAMMQGNTYSEDSLIQAIEDTFGKDERFYTCSAENLTATELVSFLKAKGKFILSGCGFTMDPTKVCSH